MKQAAYPYLITIWFVFFSGFNACRSNPIDAGNDTTTEIAAVKPIQQVVKEAEAEGADWPTINPAVTVELEPTITVTAQPVVLPTWTPTSTPTVVPWSSQEVIGISRENQGIMAYRFGNGSHWFVTLGAIHGAHECNTNQLLENIVDRISTEPTLLPEGITLFVVPLINPYGCEMNSRTNSQGVDLNRNWQTDDWTADSEGPAGIEPGAGGAYPFSEPETSALSNWLILLRERANDEPLHVISYHSLVSPNGLVQPGYRVPGIPDPAARELAEAYAYVSGYPYSSIWIGNYSITGEFIHWATENGIVAIDVELPDGNAATTIPVGRAETHVETNLRSLMAVMRELAAKS